MDIGIIGTPDRMAPPEAAKLVALGVGLAWAL
jgi:hypothetical protein